MPTTVTVTTTGAGSFTIPAGVTSITDFTDLRLEVEFVAGG